MTGNVDEVLIDWLYELYNKLLAEWSHSDGPTRREYLRGRLDSYASLALFLIARQKGPVALLGERLLPFTQHTNINVVSQALDAKEDSFLCEECGDSDFLEGPHGGLSINFCCGSCWARYNDTVFTIVRDGFVREEDRGAFFRDTGWRPRPETVFRYRQEKRR